jgi:hypothetical protein
MAGGDYEGAFAEIQAGDAVFERSLVSVFHG